jgi:hypothetical protein
MSIQESPYREEDAEARARLDEEQHEEFAEQARLRELARRALAEDAKQRKAFAKKERRQRKELAEQARIQELSRHALENTDENESRQQFRWDVAIGVGAIVGTALGGVGWWAIDDWSVFLVAPIVGVIFGAFFAGI